jgi:hypothetical protein
MSSIFARALSNASTSPVTEEILDEESISELSKIGSNVHDDIRAAKDPAIFLKEIRARETFGPDYLPYRQEKQM